MCSVSGNILHKNRNVTKGVKVEIGTEEAAVDLYVIVEYGTPIQRAAMDAQENVRKAIESMTGLHVVRVDVHVQGVSFEKENSTLLQSGAQSAALEAGETEPEKLEEPAPEPEPEKSAEPVKPAKTSRKNSKAKKEEAEPAEEEKPSESEEA